MSQLEGDALCPEVLEAALSRVLDRLTTPEPDAGKRRRLLTAKGKTLDRELARLTAAVAAGGPLKTLVSAITTAERQADQIEFELGRLDGQAPLTSRDRERINKALRTRLDDWRALLRRHVPQARQILRKLLVDRVVFTPKTDHYAFVGTWTLGRGGGPSTTYGVPKGIYTFYRSRIGRVILPCVSRLPDAQRLARA